MDPVMHKLEGNREKCTQSRCKGSYTTPVNGECTRIVLVFHGWTWIEVLSGSYHEYTDTDYIWVLDII